MQHPLRKPGNKAPNPESEAAADAKERLAQYINRWDVQAVIKGTTDAAAPLQAAKGLLALMGQLQRHRNICRRAEVRQQYGKQLSSGLLAPLLSCSNKDAVSVTLQALQDYCRLLPGLLTAELVKPVVQLTVAGRSHGASAAKLLTEQLTHWRISHVLPVWVEHNGTQQLLQHMQQALLLPAQHPATAVSSSNASGSTVGLDMCSSYLALLARLVSLAEQQLVQQLTADVDTASSWLQVLVAACQQQQHHGAVSLAQYSIMMDNCCQLLAFMSRTAAVATVLQSNAKVRAGVLEVLHRVLQKPCDCRAADVSTLQRWMHAAQAAAAPILWRSPAASEQCREALLADFVLSAAATVINTRRSLPYGHPVSNQRAARSIQQLETAAVLLLVVAVTPPAVPFGSRRRIDSRCMSVLLSSDSFNLFLHELMTPATGHDQAVSCAPSAAAVCSSSSSSRSTDGKHVSPALVASPAGVLLRLVCLQYTEAYQAAAADAGQLGRNNRRSSKRDALMHPRTLLKYLQDRQCGYGIVEHMATCVLSSKLQLLLCRTALQPSTYQQRKEQQQRSQSSCGGSGSSSCSCSDEECKDQSAAHSCIAEDRTIFGVDEVSKGLGDRCSESSAAVWEGIKEHWRCLQSTVTSEILPVDKQSSNNSDCYSKGRRFSQTDQEILMSYAVLDIATKVQELAVPSASEAKLVLQTAVTALRLVRKLLMRLLGSNSSNHYQQQQQQGSLNNSQCISDEDCHVHSYSITQPVENEGFVECVLAALQGLILLGRYVIAQLPCILACLCSGSSSSQLAADARSAAALLQQLQCDLNAALQQTLSCVAASSSAVESVMQPAVANQCSNRTNTTPEALLQHQLENELRCCSAAALASCFGQFGSSGSSLESLLAAAREPGSEFLDAVLLLPGKSQQQQQQEFPIHASLVAAGCPVLGKQLLSAAAAVAANSSGSATMQVSLSAAVDSAALQHALDYIYSGRAVLHNAGLSAHLAVAVPAITNAHSHAAMQKQKQQEDVINQAVHALHVQQEQNAAELQALGKLARKLQLPLLAALCSEPPLPYMCQQLQQLHPRLDSLLPQHILLLPSGLNEPQQQQQQLEQQVVQVSTCSSHDRSGRVAMIARHTSCQQYLEQISAYNSMSSTVQHYIQHSLLQKGDKPTAVKPHTANDAAASAEPECFDQSTVELQLADVFLAAPAFVVQHTSDPASTSQQQQESGVALLPAHRVLLSRSCQYFEALLSDRWGASAVGLEHDVHCYDQETNAQQQQQQMAANRPPRVITVPEADVHVLAALQHWLYTGQLRVKLPENVVLSHPVEMHHHHQQESTMDQPGSVNQLSGWSRKLHIEHSGCSATCHASRTLLRLWRCAELLLLPELQQQCLAAVAAAAGQQCCCGCCLVLLSDCEQLGVAAAADEIIMRLVERFGAETATACPEWRLLSPALQNVLTAGWLDKQRQ